MRAIPTAIGILIISVLAAGCSDAQKVASTFEKLCKAQCECPDTMEHWNEVSNCKQHCRGDAIMLEAVIEDEIDSEPCGEIDSILADLKRCAQNSCGESRYQCIKQNSDELLECWDFFDSPFGYEPDPLASELTQQLLAPIPDGLEPETLHSAD